MVRWMDEWLGGWMNGWVVKQHNVGESVACFSIDLILYKS